MPASPSDTEPSSSSTSPRSSRKKPASTPPTLILLVRHGTTPTTGKVLPGRAAGLHLSDRGQLQAATVAKRLHDWSTAPPSATTKPARSKKPPEPKARITAVYASPLERTRETATPIAESLGLDLQIEPGLLECDFGEWTGAELKQLMKQPEWTTVQRYPSGFRFPGGESFTSMQARIVDTLTELCRRHPGEAIVTVSHADPIKAAVAEALGSHLDLFQRIVISPCSVTVISYSRVGPTVLAVNSTEALTDLIPS